MTTTLTRTAARSSPARDRLRLEITLPTLALCDDRAVLRLLLERRCPAAGHADAVEALMERFGSLADLVAADAAELARAGPLDPAAILELKLLRELSVRITRDAACARPVLSSWRALSAYVRAALAQLPREQFRALYLDRRNILMRDELVADGTVDHAPVYPREVIRRALELSASALILVHNHPSGDPTPSQADIVMTRQIVDAARVFGLQVHDHLVVGREGSASFRSLGLM